MVNYIVVAINREPLAAARRIAARTGQAVFGTMDHELLARLAGSSREVPVYFYEPG